VILAPDRTAEARPGGLGARLGLSSGDQKIKKKTADDDSDVTGQYMCSNYHGSDCFVNPSHIHPAIHLTNGRPVVVRRRRDRTLRYATGGGSS